MKFPNIITAAVLVGTLAAPAQAQQIPQLPPSAVQTRAKAGVPQQVTLQQAIDIAVAKSPVLAGARANQQLAQIPVNLARTAIFPNISAAGTVTRNNQGVFQGRTTFLNTTSVGLNGTLRQLIYDGGRFIAELHQARANAVAGTETYDRDLQTLAFNVAQSYYTALQAQSSTQLAVQVVHQNEVQENLVRAQLRAGTASRVDLATVQLPTAQARVALVRAQGQEASALAAFANTMGLDADTAVAPVNAGATSPSTLVTVLSYDQSVARALLLRPDYLAAEHSVMAAQYNVQVQRSGLLPTLNGSASYGTNSTSVTGGDFRPGSTFEAALNIPLFDQGITRAQTEQAQAQLDLVQSQLDQTRLGVELSVRDALVGLVTAQGAVAQAQAELAKAQEILKATQAQYRAGVTTLPLLLNAQVGLTTAQTDELNAVYALRQAEQTYTFALGENTIAATP